MPAAISERGIVVPTPVIETAQPSPVEAPPVPVSPFTPDKDIIGYVAFLTQKKGEPTREFPITGEWPRNDEGERVVSIPQDMSDPIFLKSRGELKTSPHSLRPEYVVPLVPGKVEIISRKIDGNHVVPR